MAYNVGLVGPYDYDGVIQNDFFAAAVLWYANRAPLVTRLPNRPSNASVIKAVDDGFRVHSTAINVANGINNSATSIVVDDGSFFEPGDVIEMETEACLVTAISSNTLTVTRGHGSTTAASHADDLTVYLIGNTRTGAEVDQDANTKVFDTSLTYPQTVQKPYQIGGSLEARSSNMSIPMGYASLVGYQRAKAAMETLFDFERSAYYGYAVALATDTTRPMMRGLRQRLTTNKTTSPTNASAYKPSDLQRDLFSAARARGGEPNVLVCDSKFLDAFAIWGINLQQLAPGSASLGVDIRTYYAQDLGGVNVIVSPLLRNYTAFCLTQEEVYWAWVREPFDQPRGKRGDATEGDVIGEGTLVVNNEAHHAWVEGITAFAKQS